MIKTPLKTIAFSVLLLAFAALPARAEDPQFLGEYGKWRVYSFAEGGNKTCFMSGAPVKQTASVKNIRRGDAYFFITHWTGDKSKNIVSISMGYPLKEGSQVTATVDGKAFSLLSNMSSKPEEVEVAWTRDQATDDALTQAVRRGSSLVVKGTSRRGTVTTDTYSLKGSGDAYTAMSKACGY